MPLREPLDPLLRGEKLAVEAYSRLADLAPSRAFAEAMHRLLAGHRVAFRALEARRPTASGLPAGEGAWGALLHARADDLQGGHAGAVPRLVGALRQAEDDCLEGYARALGDRALSSTDRVLLLSVLMPEQRTHEAILSAIDERAAVT
jgi:hypothetical protein